MGVERGNRPERLSQELPDSWRDYVRWGRRSRGLRSFLAKRRLDLGVSQAELGRRLRQRLPEAAGLSDQRVTNKLSDFFRGQDDLELEWLRGILETLEIGAVPALDPVPLDLARKAWESKRPKGELVRLNGIRAHSLIHTAPRFFDAFLRSDLSKPPARAKVPYEVSPSHGAIWVREGRLCAQFLQLGAPVYVAAGGMLLYDGTFPHHFSSEDGATVIHLSTSYERSGGRIFRTRPFDYTGPLGDELLENPTAAWRANIAIALQRSRRPHVDLAPLCGLAKDRVFDLSKGGRAPTEKDIRRAAAGLRMPESWFYQGFDAERAERTFCVVTESDILEPARKPIRPGEFTHYRTGQWGMTPIRKWPPATTWASVEGFLASVIVVKGPKESRDAEWRYHHFGAEPPNVEDPGEEFIVVLEGRLGMRFREHEQDGVTCEGVLDAGDCIFFSSELEHSFFCPSEPATVLHFWCPYPQSTLGDTVDQAGEEPA